MMQSDGSMYNAKKISRFFYKLCFISFNRSGKLVSVSVLLLRSITYL